MSIVKLFTCSALLIALFTATFAVPFISRQETEPSLIAIPTTEISETEVPVPTTSLDPSQSIGPTPSIPPSSFTDDDDEDEAEEATGSVEPEESSGPEEVCVDAKYLSHIPSHQLVHHKHIMSDVLCPADSSLPCATSNHMIRFNNQAMSYGQYCESTKCTRDKMEVNSVLSHLWTDEKHGNNVVLTMYDSRHPEMAQRLLHRFVASRRAVTKMF